MQRRTFAFVVAICCSVVSLPCIVHGEPRQDLENTHREIAELKMLATELLRRIEQLERQFAARAVDAKPCSLMEDIGLVLETISPAEFQKLSRRYRGGMRITAVRPESPAPPDHRGTRDPTIIGPVVE